MWGFYPLEVCVLSVSAALESLRGCLDDEFPASSGTRIFDVSFPLHDAFDPLLWCGISLSGRSFTGNSAAATKSLPRSGR
ncbi:Menaquinone-specific isochorismate synthase [Raoultella terrigena]|nr:Menaquinone-specific isochorismate synthase [Raoultella terrigena]